VKEKAFSHVMIDRFTGGAKDGALFTEGVTATKETVVINIHVHESAFSNGDKHIREAFEAALADLAEGRLLLGGGVAKGHGIFTGTIQKPAKTQSI
jgi:hypothetical protein